MGETFTRRAFVTGACAAAGGAFAPRAMATTSQEAPKPVPAADEKVTAETVAEAEKLAGVTYTPAEREQMLSPLAESADGYRRRQSHPLANATGPAQVFDPRLPGMRFDHLAARCLPSSVDPGPLPAADVDLAFAPVTALSQWIARGDLTSERLTRIYLERLERHGPRLECVITLTPDLAMAQARRADAELAAGQRRGPLHGIPWGAKDLLDTAGIRTTWGATPYKDRVPDGDATVVRRLEEAGAVLVAKLTLGALAYNDIWFGGRTRNPFNAERGSSGSSAGSAAATAAGLVGFSIGTETLGSIVSPCVRCGATGLRPTFGRVSRAGAMALCWSLDKIGPICRSVEDCALVLDAINGGDPGDPTTIEMPFEFDAAAPIEGLRVGYDPKWLEGPRPRPHDQATLDAARALGAELVEIEIPELPYASLYSILTAEAAAAFERLTLDDTDDQLVWQDAVAWPNSFRAARFIPAIEYVQAERIRRETMAAMASVFADVDVLAGPNYAGAMLLITNNTGHPSVTLRSGFTPAGQPMSTTLWGRLFEEGTICRLGAAIESRLKVAKRRPPEA